MLHPAVWSPIAALVLATWALTQACRGELQNVTELALAAVALAALALFVDGED